jgi:hypothetical protein
LRGCLTSSRCASSRSNRNKAVRRVAVCSLSSTASRLRQPIVDKPTKTQRID